ncbi:MAG: nucleotidyltransferase domain-containing protein [Segetibacter sp.]
MKPSGINKTAQILGLKDGDLQNIIAVLQQEQEVKEAIIFGSRAKGNYKKGSDVDIALKGTGIGYKTTSNISYILNEETQMPYKFDVLNYHMVTNKDLTEHINRTGISFYNRSETDL